MQTLANTEDLGGLRRRLLTVEASDARQWGMMAAADMVIHLRQIFRAVMGEIHVDTPPMRKPVPLPGSMLKFLALRVPRRWPTTIQTPEPFRVGSAWMQHQTFPEDRDEAVASLERFSARAWKTTSHPMFGAMTSADWMRWGWLHVDHHLRQFGR